MMMVVLILSQTKLFIKSVDIKAEQVARRNNEAKGFVEKN